MKIPCKEISKVIFENLNQTASLLKDNNKNPCIADVLIGTSDEQLSFVNIKKRIAQKIGIGFKLLHYPEIKNKDAIFKNLAHETRKKEVTGVIVQLPLPAGFHKQEVYKNIPLEKEIEGHMNNKFQFPLTLSVLTAIKYVYGSKIVDKDLIVSLPRDVEFFKTVLKSKQIVVVGKGITAGLPVINLLNSFDISVQVVDSKTINPEKHYQRADIIITAVGKKIISPESIKKGVVLLNVGLRKENGFLKGDYDEQEIKEKASFYTQTPGGLGPIDVLYLYKNLLNVLN